MELNTIVSEVGTLVDIRDVSVNKELLVMNGLQNCSAKSKNPLPFKVWTFYCTSQFFC